MTETIRKSSSRFYGVYLLCSQSTEKYYKNKCYIGYTVNPNRRINQHNRGVDYGGARKTSNKGPWKMILIVHNFPNNIAALQFEWAWQQPNLSSRLKPFVELRRKQPKESHLQYNFRILNRMLQVGPWKRLPLIIHWLETEYECEFVSPSHHMQVVSGKIAELKGSKSKDNNTARAIWAPECHLCMQRIDNPARSRIGCLNSLCKLTCHLVCLANHLISGDVRNSGHYIPISGECPLCEVPLTWTALLQRKHKINNVSQNNEADDYDDESISSDESDDSISKLSGEKIEIFELSD